jgi:hypothetical protein
MKHILFLAVSSLVLTAAAFADNVYYSSITPKSAKSMAMGGVFTAVPTTEFSFFGNPAAFASKDGTLLAPSVDAWTYIRPTFSNIGDVLNSAKSNQALASTMINLMPQNGGTGGGASATLGYAGNGLGLGAFFSNDTYIEGSSPASAILHSYTEAGAIIGLGVPIRLGSLDLLVGGDLRPFYRVSLDDTVLADMITAGANAQDSISTNSFFGVAMDLGATLQLGSLILGLSIRDITPTFPLAKGLSLTEFLDILSAGRLPDTSASTTTASLMPNITAGLSWAPKLWPGLVDPSLYFEIQDPLSVFSDSSGIGTALNLLHLGAEVKFLNFINLRAGINRGWISAGAGFKLLFLDLNAAVFTEELGSLPGDNPRSGLALQAVLKFF